MEKIFNSKQVAIVGVSDTPTNLGKHIISNLIEFGFAGSYYAVGASEGTVFGHRIYQSVLDIPGDVDLAMILVKAKDVPSVAESCGQKGIKRMVISSGGFSEYRPENKALEQELLGICRKYGIRFIGPNCLAVINMENGLFLPFAPHRKTQWKKGSVGIISQSGGVATHMAQRLCHQKVGISKVASIGNKLNVDEVDLLQFYIEDPETKIIYLYLEGLSRARELFELLHVSPKPILIHKSNIFQSSNKIAHSHTASLASDEKVVDAAFKQAGIIRVTNFEEAVNCIKTLMLPPLKGNKLVGMSPGGGPSVILADEARRYGFTMPTLPRDFLDWLESKERAKVITLTNPIDCGDLYNLDVHIEAIERLRKLPGIDAIFYDIAYSETMAKVLGREAFERLFEYCTRVNQCSSVPVMIASVLTEPDALDELNKLIPFPIFDSITGCFNAMKMVWESQQAKSLQKPLIEPEIRAADKIASILEDAVRQGKTFLDYEGYEILDALKLPAVKQCFLPREAAAEVPRMKLKYPLVLKAVGKDLAHKTDAGGVRLNLRNRKELSQALSAMMEEERLSSARGFLMQEMVSGGTEIIVGGKRDPQFGPVVMVGIGGVLVEIFSDVKLAVAPIDMETAQQMVQSLKGFPLLQGYRGMPPADIDSLCAIVKGVSDLMVHFPLIGEIDLNPVRVFGPGESSAVLDCKFFLISKT
ncbi:MAG: acetate--CoA ligase family protein [Smithellaceae bacterium]